MKSTTSRRRVCVAIASALLLAAGAVALVALRTSTSHARSMNQFRPVRNVARQTESEWRAGIKAYPQWPCPGSVRRPGLPKKVDRDCPAARGGEGGQRDRQLTARYGYELDRGWAKRRSRGQVRRLRIHRRDRRNHLLRSRNGNRRGSEL